MLPLYKQLYSHMLNPLLVHDIDSAITLHDEVHVVSFGILLDNNFLRRCKTCSQLVNQVV